jgi:hypothetical protein
VIRQCPLILPTVLLGYACSIWLRSVRMYQEVVAHLRLLVVDHTSATLKRPRIASRFWYVGWGVGHGSYPSTGSAPEYKSPPLRERSESAVERRGVGRYR